MSEVVPEITGEQTHHQQQGAEGLLMDCLFALVVFLVGVGVGFVIRVMMG